MRELYELYISTFAPGWPAPNVLTYSVLLIGCFAYAWWRGGGPEKASASILIIGSFLTLVAVSRPGPEYISLEIGILIIDLVCMAAFVAVALRADRYWPLWLATLQIAGTAVHLIKFLHPETTRIAYAFLLAIWSYPMIVLICVGTWRHQRRLVRFGFDRSWSNSLGGATARPWSDRRSR